MPLGSRTQELAPASLGWVFSVSRQKPEPEKVLEPWTANTTAMGGIWGSKKKTKEDVTRPPGLETTASAPSTVLVGEPGDDPEAWETDLVARLLADFQQRQGIDLRRDEIAVKRVRAATERARLALATEQTTQLTLPFITADASGPKTLDAEIRKSEG